jgi:hypothetical protein
VPIFTQNTIPQSKQQQQRAIDIPFFESVRCAMLRSIDIPAAFVFPVLLLLLQIAVTSVWGTLPFGNRNGDSGAAGGFVGGVGGGRRNNPRLPVSPEAYMSSVSYFTFIIPSYIFQL